MRVAYIIASHNRRAELIKTLASCRAQIYPDKEIHVVDDGSSDGTFDGVCTLFPEVIITRNDPGRGSVASRNQMFRRAGGDILIGFDDDSRFLDPHSTTRVVERFQAEPDLGLLDFQDIGPEFPERIAQNSPGRCRGEWHVSSFGAGRFALRRTVLERTGLFPEFFWHAYEEPDLALRIWDCGYRCLRWNEILVWHEFSGMNRDEKRTHYFHARNELLSIWMRAPVFFVMPLTLWRMGSQLRYSLRRGWGPIDFTVWRDALKMLGKSRQERKAIRTETFLRCLWLNRRRIADPGKVWQIGKVTQGGK